MKEKKKKKKKKKVMFSRAGLNFSLLHDNLRWKQQQQQGFSGSGHTGPIGPCTSVSTQSGEAMPSSRFSPPPNEMGIIIRRITNELVYSSFPW